MSKETIIRTVILIVALLNQVLVITGHSIFPVNEEQLTELISVAFTVVTALIAWWKNNSFTAEAIEADRYLAQLRGDKDV